MPKIRVDWSHNRMEASAEGQAGKAEKNENSSDV